MGDVFLNILKDSKDPHYRYKMPKLTTKVEGSGNGIKTVITNMAAVAKALGRPPSYPTKYFGCELGAQVTINNDCYVVNGSHDPENLLNLLYAFIRKFVLCSKCNNPETTLSVSGQIIRQKCIACGYATTIPKPLHKLTTFIINHPPDGSASTTSSSSKSGKSGKGDKKSKKGDKNGGNTSPTNGQGDSGNDLNDANDDFDDFDDEDLSVDAYIERQQQLIDGLPSASTKLNSKDSANLFYKLVKDKKEANQLGDINVHKDLFKEAELLDFKDKSTLILSELLFTENILEEIKQHKMLLLRFCQKNAKAQKYLLGGFEKIVGDVYKDQLLGSAMKILKQFYDEDIIDEETIIEWSQKESKKYVSKETSKKIHEKVAPFIKWLKEAEVEDDDDEETEEEEVKPKPATTNNNAKPAAQSNSAPATNGQKKTANDDEDDDDDLFEFSHRVSGIEIQEVKPTVSVKPINADVEGPSANANGGGEDDIDIDNI